jgi:hypothetical protein
MMSDNDSRIVLSELEASPPEWVLYLDLNQAEFERVFPSGKGLSSHFPQLENWIKANYHPEASPSLGGLSLGGYVLMHRRGV